LGNWLTVKQAQTLLNTPDASKTKGLRGRAILAVLLGCGLRRSEFAALTFGHVRQRDGRWCVVDLVGKHGRVRTIPMPTWVKGGNRCVDRGGGHCCRLPGVTAASALARG
jgi:site-specific recombinase XerD